MPLKLTENELALLEAQLRGEEPPPPAARPSRAQKVALPRPGTVGRPRGAGAQFVRFNPRPGPKGEHAGHGWYFYIGRALFHALGEPGFVDLVFPAPGQMVIVPGRGYRVRSHRGMMPRLSIKRGLVAELGVTGDTRIMGKVAARPFPHVLIWLPRRREA